MRIQYFLVFGVLSYVPCLHATNLTMHIFDGSEASTPVANTVAVQSVENTHPMNMVIFPNDTPNHPVSDAPPDPVFQQTSQNDFSFSYDLETGYQQEQLDFEISDAEAGAGVETQWKNVDSAKASASFKMDTPMGVVFKGGGSYLWTVDGRGQETSYLAGDRANPTSQANSNASDGYGWDISLATGYKFKWGNAKNVALSLTPLVGYSWQERKNTLYQGQDMLNPDSSVSAAKNIYLSSWNGPWAGMEAQVDFLNKHRLFSEVQYHWADYKANANWARLADVKSISHDGNAEGVLALVGYQYKLTQQLAMKIAVDYQHWQVRNGREKLKFSDDSDVISAISKINRKSLGVNLGINFAF